MIGIQWLNGKLRIARISKKGKKVELRDYIEVEIPTGDFWNRGLEEVNLVKERIEKVFRENKIKDKEIVMLFESKDISLRTSEYPYMSIKELEMAILDDLEEYQAFDENYSLFTFSMLDQDKSKIRTTVATIPKVIVNTWESIFKNLGCKLVSFELSFVSGTRYILWSGKNKYPNGIIFIGNETTDLVFIKEKKINSIINLSVGINDFYNLDELSFDTTFLSWQEELITYLNSAFYELGDKNIVIFGEDERYFKVAENFVKNLSLDYKVDIIENLNISLLGTALYDVNILRINFIKERILIDRELIIRSLISFLLALSLIFPINFYFDLKIRDLDRKINYLQSEILKYNDQISNLRKEVDNQNAMVQILEKWLEERSAVSLPFIFLSDLRYFIPKNVWLTAFDIGIDKKLIIEGYSLDTEGVADFLLALSRYERIKSIKLESAILEIMENKEVQKFRVVGYIK
jgi:Tfp pilus assembly PilM family ATPase/Tfp pilus assembly protein PilN